MFYFKSTIDERFEELEESVELLEKENHRLTKILEAQGIETNWWNRPDRDYKRLHEDFHELVGELGYHIKNSPPTRKFVKKDES